MMTKQDLISLLKDYNFINNSIRSFCHKYNIHYNTVSKYLRENNIPYNRKESILARDRDVNGRFILSIYTNKDENTRIKCRSFKDLQSLKL